MACTKIPNYYLLDCEMLSNIHAYSRESSQVLVFIGSSVQTNKRNVSKQQTNRKL